MLGKSLIKAAAGNAGVSADPNFSDTTLLLQGDTSNESMLYNAFGDASSNAHDITPVGDVHGSPFSPYNESWSVEFDGDDYLQLPDDSSMAVGTGDFCLECFVYATANANGNTIISNLTANDAQITVVFRESGKIGVTGYNLIHLVSSSLLPLNQWVHIAVVRSGTTFSLYFDGTREATTTNSTNFSSTTGFRVGDGAAQSSLTGSVSNARLVKGDSVYDPSQTSISVPTAPLTAITGTSFLTCNANRFIDTSSNAHTITVNGDPEVKGFSPFTDTDTVTGSGYFDGSGDYLVATSGTDFVVGTGDFTAEGWAYTSDNTRLVGAYSQRLIDIDNGSLGIWIQSSTGYLSVNVGTSISSTTVFPENQWNHFALTRSGSSLKLFLNGTEIASATNTNNLGSSGVLTVGSRNQSSDGAFLGYIANCRLVKGTAVYTSAFTPPTSPLTAVSGTSLLTLQNRGANRNIGFIDSSHPTRVITRNGNVTQGSFSPFSKDEGKWGNYFDGSGDYLSWTGTNVNAGDFTLEAWIYPTANGSGSYGGKGIIACGDVFLNMGLDTNNKISARWYTGSGQIVTSSSSVNLYEWTHVAVTLERNVAVKIYINGVLDGTSTTSVTPSSATNWVIGREGQQANYFQGYISNARVTTDIVYTGAFTPSTTPLEATVSSDILTCQSNRFIDNSTNAHAITVNGTPKVVPFSPFPQTTPYSADTNGGSGYFDGSGDYLQVAGSSDFNLTGDFTVEFWIYNRRAAQTYEAFFGIQPSNGQAGLRIANQTPGTTFRLISGSGTYSTNIGGDALEVDTWSHIAMTRSGTTVKAFINGIEQGSNTDSGWVGTNLPVLIAAGRNAASGALNQYNAYFSDVRIVKGTALYTSAFTPPTAPLTDVTNTELLCNFTNAGIYDGTGRNVLETVGDAHVENAVKKYGTGSMEVLGNGNQVLVNLTNRELINFGTGDFTVEYWLNTTSDANQNPPFSFDWSTGNGGWYFGHKNFNGKYLVFGVGTTPYQQSWNWQTNQWYHVAVTRSGTDLKLFVDGTQLGSTMTSSDDIQAYDDTFRIGTNSEPNTVGFSAYIDDLRITKGVARYTANFTPPAAKLPNL